MIKYLILIIIISISCENNKSGKNKSIILYPVEPFEIYKNDILFSRPETQNLWISFQSPLVKNYSPGAYFRVIIHTNQNIENVYLKSISLNIKELDLFFIKSLMIPIPIHTDESGNSN